MLIPFTLSLALISACPSSVLNENLQSNIVFTSNFDATIWGGIEIHSKSTLAIGQASDTTVPVTLTNVSTNKSQQISAQRGICGTLKNDKFDRQLDAYNNSSLLLVNAPADLKVGSTWKSIIGIFLSDVEHVDVPVTIKIVKMDSNGVFVQATGETTGILAQYGAPFDMTYQAAALFKDGMFIRANSAAQEAVQAGPQSQTMKFAWSVARKT